MTPEQRTDDNLDMRSFVRFARRLVWMTRVWIALIFITAGMLLLHFVIFFDPRPPLEGKKELLELVNRMFPLSEEDAK